MIRLPHQTKTTLDALSGLTGTPIWRLVDQAVEVYVQALPEGERKLLWASGSVAPRWPTARKAAASRSSAAIDRVQPLPCPRGHGRIVCHHFQQQRARARDVPFEYRNVGIAQSKVWPARLQRQRTIDRSPRLRQLSNRHGA